eukprot:CAMPEP_0185351688 /NCGR_PEP_ID=MMETSP1364-20130426/3581_1 /TAXON_ID=38817 /ORGANISM="Gephyrocapsa oceanica, Strain RCC1303" /LENGTH=135 /DNA_ID=CAMNT_0027951257 /DNA_START=150 /DNA_END=554 /DNA_ORIENTATION=-
MVAAWCLGALGASVTRNQLRKTAGASGCPPAGWEGGRYLSAALPPRGGEFACAATPVSAHRIGSQILRIDPNVPPPAYIQLVCSMCLTSSRSSAMIEDIFSRSDAVVLFASASVSATATYLRSSSAPGGSVLLPP